eukprot:3751117-Prorocentrum_lima.AAC.1
MRLMKRHCQTCPHPEVPNMSNVLERTVHSFRQHRNQQGQHLNECEMQAYITVGNASGYLLIIETRAESQQHAAVKKAE